MGNIMVNVSVILIFHYFHVIIEIIKLLENSVANSNLCVEKLNQKRKETTSPYPYLHVKFFKYERKLVPSSVNQIKANGFTSFYHFFLSRNDNAVNDSENESYVLNAKCIKVIHLLMNIKQKSH